MLDLAEARTLFDSIDVTTPIGLRENGGEQHEMLWHHTVEEYLHAYLDGTGIADD